MKDITIIVPCFNESSTVKVFYEETKKTLENDLPGVSFDFIFIDDGSNDDTLLKIKELSEKDNCVKYISFSRNFGKEAAIFAGLKNSTGRNTVIMDSDLQDPPSLLKEMYLSIENEGFDTVSSRRVSRKGEPRIRSFFARCFYKIMRKISKIDLVDGARDFQMMNKKVVSAVLSMGEYNRFSKGIFSWVGFKKKWLEYENVERFAGESKWSFFGLLLYAIDGIVAFSTAPLIISSVIGLFFFIAAFIAIIFIIIRTLIFGDPTSGWPSMVCIIMLVSGVQLFCIGILGQYIAKTYLETKNRPLYLIEETNLQPL